MGSRYVLYAYRTIPALPPATVYESRVCNTPLCDRMGRRRFGDIPRS